MQFSTSQIVWQKKVACGGNCWLDSVFPLVNSPGDIIVTHVNPAAETFHARFNTVIDTVTYNFKEQCSETCGGTTGSAGQTLYMEDKNAFVKYLSIA
jgi:hypothetical protein